jgi:hypothetical protein
MKCRELKGGLAVMAELPSGPHACPGCRVPPGADHEDGCDHALCPDCGEQRILHDEHDPGRASRWHGTDPRAESAQQLGWWTTASGIDHLVEDYTRVLFAESLGQIAWDPATQRYAIGRIDEAALDAAMRRDNHR